MNVVKAIIGGAVGSLVMAVVMMIIISQGIAPFNLPPSAAFSYRLGLPAQPTGMILHFLYGMALSVVFVYLFQNAMSFLKGLGFAVVIWLIMMVVLSPIIGWGFFGSQAGTGQPEATLYLSSMPKYIGGTLIMHLIYGAVIGLLNPWWIHFES